MQQDRDGNNLVALHIAFKHGRDENIAELLRRGANPNQTDNTGNTPVDLDKRSFL